MNVGEMFAEIGGFRLGLERAGHKIVWANEWDKYACQKTWKPTLSRICPKLYCYICRRYCKFSGIQDPEFYQEEEPEID
jgi:hypothetical protein